MWRFKWRSHCVIMFGRQSAVRTLAPTWILQDVLNILDLLVEKNDLGGSS